MPGIAREGDLSKLYDLRADPYQLENQIDNQDYARLIARLAARLEQLRSG